MNSTDFNHLFFVLLNKREDMPEESLEFMNKKEYTLVVKPEIDSRFIVNF